MLEKIILTSLRQRVAIIVLTVLLSAGGIHVAGEMNVDVLPDLSAPVVTVLAEAPGMPPEEVEQFVSYPIETALIGAEGIRRVTSGSMLGFSVVRAEFEWNVEVSRARQIVSERLQGVSDRMPDRAGSPFLAPVTSIMGEILMIGFTTGESSLVELRTAIEYQIRRELLAMPGIAAVSVYGGETRQYVVEPDPYRLAQLEVPLDEVITAASAASSGMSGGFFNYSGMEHTIRGFGRARNVTEIGLTPLPARDGEFPLLLGDVADVKTGVAPKIGDASINATPGIVLMISKEPGADTRTLTRQVEERLRELAPVLPQDVTVHTELFRQAGFIDLAVNNVTQALWISGLLVVIILFLFLNHWRVTLISLSAIPVSVLLAILVLWFSGMTINTMTLAGIAIAIGVLVDDAIVFVENVFRRLRDRHRDPPEQRKSFLDTVADASMEIKGPIVLANFVIVVVFLPFLFLGGLEGRLLLPLGVAYATTIICSLIVALTLTPAMCIWLLDEHRESGIRQGWLSRNLDSAYRPVLDLAFRYRPAVVGSAILLFLITLMLIPGIGRSFLPEFNEGALNIGVSTLPGTSLEESNRLGNQVEQILLAHPSVVSTARRTGRAERDEHTMGSHGHEIEVQLSPDPYDRERLFEELRRDLASVPGIHVSLDQPISHRIDHMLTGVRTSLAVKIFGPDRERLQSLSSNLERLMREEGTMRDILTADQLDVPQLQILPDRSRMAMHGLTTADLSRIVETAFAGAVVDQIFIDPALFDLVVRFPDRFRASPAAISETPVGLPGGGLVRIGDLADVRVDYAPNFINRENASRVMITQANIAGGDPRGTVERLRAAAGELNLEGGYSISFEGQFEQEERTTRIILLVSLVSLILIFLSLKAIFRSTGQVVLILLNLPLALMGGILVVRFGSGMLTIAGLIGFITLFGIAVRNGIILISRYNELLAGNRMSVRRAVLSGSVERLQPILMTVITTALALLPLVLAGSRPGNEIQAPMAAVILGGLLTATLLNMILVPLLFDWYLRRKEKDAARSA